MDPGDPRLPSEGLGGSALGEGQPPWVAASGPWKWVGGGPPGSGGRSECVTGGVAWRPGQPPTIVVKAVGDLVPDHHPDAPEVQGLWLLLAEKRGLEDPGGEHCGEWEVGGDRVSCR